MNKTVQLVNEWATFEEAHPDADIESFCRYYLTQQRSRAAIGEPFQGKGIPPNPGSFLMKLFGYIGRVFELYLSKAMVDIPEIKQPEDFYFLNNIYHYGECRKTEVTNYQLMGLSTGVDTLNRLLANGLIEERTDPADKRARLVKTTEKGEVVLKKCYQRGTCVNQIVFKDLSTDDLKLCIQLLRPVEVNNSKLAIDARDLPFEAIYEKVFGEKPPFLDLPAEK